MRQRQAYAYHVSSLRKSKFYYLGYCVGLNTLVASVIPLLALIYLNICTVKALRKMSFEHTQIRQTFQLTQTAKSEDQDPNEVEGSKEGKPRTSVFNLLRNYGLASFSISLALAPDHEPLTPAASRPESRLRTGSFSDEVKAQERRLARISIAIVWLFIVCHMWKLIPTIYESTHSEDGIDVSNWPFWLTAIEYISHSLIVFNSAVNFLVYILL